MKKIVNLLICFLLLFTFASCARERVFQNSGADGSQSGSGGQNQSQQENVLDEEGGDVALLEGEYENLLREGLGDLYPCQYVTVYVEQQEDWLTYAPYSAMNAFLLSCGGDSITSAYLTLDTKVDASFVARHDPAVIVKWVDSSILGKNVTSLDGAKAVKRSICRREGLQDVAAVKTGSVLLLSNELMESERGRLVAKLFLAKGMYPSLFPEFDLDRAIFDLIGEGTFVYFE